jgi:hypothetical protein
MFGGNIILYSQLVILPLTTLPVYHFEKCGLGKFVVQISEGGEFMETVP